VADASQPMPLPSARSTGEAKWIRVLNKCDLGEDASWQKVDAVRLSCATGLGFDLLSDRIRDSLRFGDVDWGEHAVAVNARHRDSLLRARSALQAALSLLESGTSDPEIAAIDLREALEALGEIPGRVDTEDLLGVIFSRFCIGK
jgi:tRNA modification GTPase